MTPDTARQDASLADARAVADAVLYEGYLLYPYRASSAKNQVRWQFGVLGPPGAAESGIGEDPRIASDCLLRTAPAGPGATVRVLLRFLQLQARGVEELSGNGFVGVARLAVGASQWLTWDEAAEVEHDLGTFVLDGLTRTVPVEIPGGVDVEVLHDGQGRTAGRLVRRRLRLHGAVTLAASTVGDDLVRLSVSVQNTGERDLPADGPTSTAAQAIATSFIGAHLMLAAQGATFVSLRDPGPAREAADACHQHRCWPVLGGTESPAGSDVLLVSPIILDDYPELAPESGGALFDSTEIDEILTLRILTMTEEEKAEARATDPRAAEIIDRCEQMTSDDMASLHGRLRDPRALEEPGVVVDPFDVPTFVTPTEGRPWWDPETDASVDPAHDAVQVGGVRVSRGSLVRIAPARRADAQDLFFAGRDARVAGVHHDVDGGTHVAVVILDDPAADLHDWYGRYLYFAPDELEPLAGAAAGSSTGPEQKGEPSCSSSE